MKKENRNWLRKLQLVASLKSTGVKYNIYIQSETFVIQFSTWVDVLSYIPSLQACDESQ